MTLSEDIRGRSSERPIIHSLTARNVRTTNTLSKRNTPMTQEQQIADMATMIRTTTGMMDFIAGNEAVETAAECWVDAGFTSDDAPAWWEAGCFDAERTAELRNAGLTPEQVSERRTEEEPESWGYAYCNGDVGLAKLRRDLDI